MQKIWQFLTTRTSLIAIGWVAFAALLLIVARLLEWPASVLWIVLGLALLISAVLWLWRRQRRARAAGNLGNMLEQQVGKADPAARQETEVIRKRLQDAIATIKGSKLGQFSGNAALYELPWYMVIGNPAAGKSTAIASSGLQFPFADTKVVQGVGGTRNCDWFFTTEGILLDTAGRYSVVDEDRGEWFGFLDLLKKYRRKAPINGVIIAVSLAELTRNKPEFAINLAKNLRQRVQELTERLEVHAPVYVVFTKADLITGFNEFFQDSDRHEREKVWGATLPYDQNVTSEQLLDQFDARFDELYDGLKDLSLANMSLARERMPAGVFTFPLEFSSVKPALRAFIATLFEENPFQFKPVFRGFYFTSALQEGDAVSASSARVAQRFDLKLGPVEHEEHHEQQGYFLLNLFRKVIFADKELVAQYASPAKIRLRYAAFFAATALVGLALAGWSWSYMNNRQLVANVQADLDQAIKVQAKNLDLQSRFQALEILQDRIEQLDRYEDDRPLSLSLGLYQGELLNRKLREEYFNGVREVMLKPVAQSLEAFLAEVNANAGQLQPMTKPVGGAAPAQTADAAAINNGAQQFKDASPASAEDAYNALKTYLMLADKSRAESAHLNDQLTRFWRVWLDSNRGTMPREQMIRSAERMISFYLAQVNDPSWPVIDGKLALVDQARDNLRRVVRGMPARDRVYADVKARAATRYPSVTVARIVGEQDKELVLGSYAVSGSFTRQAWEGFIQQAFREAANRELQSADWVLKTSSKDDLTLEGSPEQIQKSLVDLYKAEYAAQWQKFMQGVTVRDLETFDGAAAAMNRLGDPQNSPLTKLMATVYEQTSWDNPSLLNTSLERAQRGIAGWFRETILRQKPSQVNVNIPAGGTAQNAALPMGPVGREFSAVARLVVAKDKDASLMRGYIDSLAKLRARFNQIKNQGDPGPGAKQLMQQTLDGSGSELADALKYVDEQMLVGMTDTQRQALRPVLVRPLMQTFAVIVKPTEAEINKVWAAQVLQPFNRGLALKYPFSTESRSEASNAEIGEIFGPDGAIAKFFNTTIGPLVVRRGDALSARTWADMGITLAPNVVANFPNWVAPLAAGGVANAAASSGGEGQTQFDVQALGAVGGTEFTMEIDGQALRWRGQPQPWVHMTWPNARGVPGAKITAITPEGRNVVVLDEPGHFGLKKMIEAAQRKRKDNGVFELSWQNGGVTVMANLKVLATTAPAPQAQAPQPGQGFKRLRLPETITAPAPARAPEAPAPSAPSAPAAPAAPAPAAPTPTRSTAAAAPVGAMQ
ncbi:type VI secretion system protein ImpL [Pseudoduganella flava]|uniref:Type VI secretion system membrane subunit TssM n=1 Tax=Pseudoduganella flava TaxID=871742 RepID=A0A562PHM4_9BURK|nr:type VI secretion system membrane subunit TssM [Pseudoduganella flava]QGZ37672.1 type VI secretion system membrane subunit TssM [Pseudoduganella flava]TWI43965.1 type VI secretion system protein ImpL [Pseudoduganella flava]